MKQQSKFLMPLDIQLFADEGGDVEQSSDETKKTDEGTKDYMIPKKRFDEVNERYKTVQAKLDEILAEKAEAELAAKKESGQYRELYEQTAQEYSGFKTQFESVDARAKELEAVVDSLLKSKLESIPEEFHELIPDNLTPEAKLDWVAKAASKGLFRNMSQEPVGKQTNGNEFSGITKEQFLKMNYRERVKLSETNPDLYKRLSR